MVGAGKAFMPQDSSNQAPEGVDPCLLIVLSFLGFTGGPLVENHAEVKVVPLRNRALQFALIYSHLPSLTLAMAC